MFNNTEATEHIAYPELTLLLWLYVCLREN